VGKAVEERRAVHTADLLRDPTLEVPGEMRALLQEEGIAAVLAAPILLPDEAYGTLTVYRQAGYRFTPEEVQLVTSLAGSAAIAIENARLFHEEQGRRRQLEAVRTITAEITRELDLTTLLELIHRRAAELVGATSGAVYLWDEADQALVPRAWHGHGEWMREVQFRLGEALTGIVAQRREGAAVNDYRSWPHASPRVLERTNVTATLGEPLLYRDRLLGVISLNHHGAGRCFAPQDREVLALFAAQAALAIENARLFGEVSRAKTEWENTFDAIADPVAVLDLDGRIVRANRALLHRVGRPPEDVFHRPCAEVFGDDGAAWGGCPHRRALRIERPVALELEDMRLGGSYAVSVFPVRDAAGRIMGTVHIARDITEQKEIQAKLAQADKLASLGTLAAGVAHSINNVLAGIVARADLLQLSGADAETRRSAEVILQAAMDGAETVRRMREFTRTEPSGAMGSVDINGAVRHALELTEARWLHEAQARGAPITVETRLEARAPVNGNVAEIGEVLVNLILNAVDAMPGGGQLRITTADRPGPPPSAPGTRSAGAVEVRVEDTGVGMPEAVRQRIFDPFFTTKGVAGTGLGLSVSYGLMTKHRGEITVRSREGEGTTFVLTFPATAAGGRRGTAPLTTSPPRRGRVLLIEDGSNLREAMAEGLVQAGHQVEVVAGGREGIERFRAEMFDVVLTDLGMPEVTGLDVAGAVKGTDPSAYVILCTGWGTVPGADAPLRERGVDALLAKPFLMDDVNRAIQTGLEARAAVTA
jgi:PAS domain S-box-containing protein